MVKLLLGRDRLEVPVHSRHGVTPDLQVQVGGALVDGGLQQVVDVHGRTYRLAAMAPTDVSQPWVSG